VLGIDNLHRQLHFPRKPPAGIHLFPGYFPQVPLLAYIIDGREPDELTGLAFREIDCLTVCEILSHLLFGELELTGPVAGELAHKLTQLKASSGLYHDVRMHLGDGGLMMLEEPQRIHPAVPNQHVSFVSGLLGPYFCILHH
jgi:hypothetical protein